MEPIQWIVAIFLVLGGYEVGKNQNQQTNIVEPSKSIVSDAPVFERGIYYKTDQGYYISDLSPSPMYALGCERPLYLTDLSIPANENQSREVTEYTIPCEIK